MRTGREVAVFVHRSGQVLLLRRARNAIWHIPAGVVEDGEPCAEAAERELFEETRLRATRVLVDLQVPQRFVPAAHQRAEYPAGVHEVALENFAIEAPPGWEPVLDAEHTAHRWVRFDEADTLFQWDEPRRAFSVLRERLGGPAPGRGPELWSRIASRVDLLRELLSAAPEGALATRCEREGWSVALVGCHVALGLRRQANWVRRVLAGSGPTVFDWERTHSLNALIARGLSVPAKADVLGSLSDGAERWRQLLESVADEELACLAFRLGENVRSVEWVAGVVAPRHIDEHMRSIRAALARTQ